MARLMVPFLAVRVTAWNNLPAKAKKMLRVVFKNIDLFRMTAGPPIMLSPDGVPHFVFVDPRWEPEDAQTIAIIVANLDKITDREWTKEEARAALDKAVARTNVVVPEGEDPFDYTLRALNAPAAVQMFAGVPDGWRYP